MASWFRRLEQGVLQGIGAVSSSYEKDAAYARDEERLERLEQAARETSGALAEHVAALRREGEGLFLATLEGPGRVWLQSMPILNLAEEIGRYLPQNNEGGGGGGGSVIGTGVAGAAIGGILGSMFGDD